MGQRPGPQAPRLHLRIQPVRASFNEPAPNDRMSAQVEQLILALPKWPIGARCTGPCDLMDTTGLDSARRVVPT